MVLVVNLRVFLDFGLLTNERIWLLGLGGRRLFSLHVESEGLDELLGDLSRQGSVDFGLGKQLHGGHEHEGVELRVASGVDQVPNVGALLLGQLGLYHDVLHFLSREGLIRRLAELLHDSPEGSIFLL